MPSFLQTSLQVNFRSFRSHSVRVLNNLTSKMVVTETKHYKTGDKFPTLPDDGKLVLLSMRFCPYAQRAHLVLDAKKIPYNTVNIHLKQKPEWLTDYSRLGKVPALGLTNEPGKPYLHESIVIADYLDEKYPERQLHAKDPLSKANDVLLIKHFDSAISAFYKIVLGATQESVDALLAALDVFETELGLRGTPFFGGDKPGMVDYMIWPWFERRSFLEFPAGKTVELSDERFGKLNKWSETILLDEAVQKWFITPEAHSTFKAGHVAGNPDYDVFVK